MPEQKQKIPRLRLIATLMIIAMGVIYLMKSKVVQPVQGEAEGSGRLAPVAISDNGKYLVDADGNPFFWMADTAWDMNHRLTREEIEIYLDDRQQKGFNVILLRIPFRDLEGEPQRDNRYGDTPFVDQDIIQPSEGYFELVDFSLTEMEKRGMTAGLLPLWGFVLNGKFGFSVSDEDISTYAQWIGNRYKDRKNIIWVSGGDTSKDPRWESLGRGLKTADPQKLVTFHPSRWATSSFHLYGDADWLDFHMTQTGHAPNLRTNYDTVNYVYNNSSKPILNGEPAYENMLVMPADKPNYKMPPVQVRKAIYWSLMAGGFGVTYGHVEIFQFSGAMPGQPFTYGADSYWMEALNAPVVNQISRLAPLLKSAPWHMFAPHQSLVASDNPSGPAHIRASLNVDQTGGFVYFPEQQTATIQLSELAGLLNARWFNPETGESQDIGVFEADGSMLFASPFAEDSLLVLEQQGDPTPTYTPGPPTATATMTSTPESLATHTPTATSAAPTATMTHTPGPTATNTAVPPTATATDSAVLSCQPLPGDRITNGHFEEGTGSWKFSSGGSGNFNTTAPAYACDLAARIRINVKGKNMQFYQQNVALKAGTAYRLTFAAFSTSGNDLTAELLKHTTPYSNYGLTQRVDLGSGWQIYSIEFTTSGFSGTVNDGRLRFRLHGTNKETYWIDAVSLVEVNSEPPTATSSATALATTTATPTATAEIPTATPSETATAVSVVTDTPTTTTAVPTATMSNTPIPTATNSPVPTATATDSDVPSCLPQPGELLTNGHFEDGTESWKFSTGGRGSFITAAPAYSCDLAGRIFINVVGKNMQFYQQNVTLKAGTAYRLTFAAFSTSGNDLTAELLKHTTPYSNYGLTQRVDLGSGWQIYSIDFTTSGFSGTVNDGRLRFRLYGKNNESYWIDSVSLQEINSTPSTEHPSSLTREWWKFLDSLQTMASSKNPY